MDIIENWDLLNDRMKEQKPQLIQRLSEIHMGAFDDLRRSGHMIKVGDKTVSQLAPTIEPEERLELAGKIGRSLIHADGNMFDKTFTIKSADCFPNGIFIALSAILENLDGSFDVLFPGKKMSIHCDYSTASENKDPLGQLLPILQECYPWIDLSIRKHTEKPSPAKPPRVISKEDSQLLFTAENIVKIDTARMAFIGNVERGIIRKGDVLNAIDDSGKVLCPEGVVLLIVREGKIVEQAESGQHIDEMCLAMEIPSGDYRAILLVDGDEALAASAKAVQNGDQGDEHVSEEQTKNEKAPAKKAGFWSRLFKK